MHFARVAIGVDFSEASAEAARWTIRSFAPGASVLLIHIQPPPERGDALPAPVSPAGSREPMQECLELRARLEVPEAAIHIGHGEIATLVGAAAAEAGSDLIALGKHGAGVRLKALGSVAERLILHSPLPLLLATGMGEGPPRNILAAVHDDATRLLVLQWAHTLSCEFDAACVALSIAGGRVRTHLLSMASLAARGGGVASHELSDGVEESAPWVSELTEESASEGAVELGAGDTAGQIVEAAGRLHSDLIVVGSSGLAAAVADPEMSVACGVARQAPCPVLVVKAWTEAPAADR